MTTNLSCLLYGPGDARFEDRPVPQIADPHDVIIRIAFVGVCGSDVHFWTHGGITRKVSLEEPIVMGHEASGVIHSVGDAVTTLKPGDRVAIEPGFSCRRCKQCKRGRYNLCPDMHFAADPPGNHGTLARFYKVPQDFVYAVSPSLSLEEAVMLEPLSVAVHGVRMAQITAGQSVLVQGAGTIGLLAAVTAKAFGASRVVISDINPSKTDFAKEYLGCTTFLTNTASTSLEEAHRLKTETNLADGADVVLECTGVEFSAQVGIQALAPGGVFVQIGMGKPDQTLPLLYMCEREIVVKTSFRYGAGDYQIALDLLETGSVSVKSLISSTTPFQEAPLAWEKTKRGEGIKNLIQGVLD